MWKKHYDNLTLFKNRAFLSVWIGFLISRMGDGFFTIALGFIVLSKSGSGIALSSIFAANMLGSILSGPFAGTYTDRVDRRKLMISMDILRFFLLIIIIWLTEAQSMSMPIIIILTFIISISSTFFSTAFSSSIVNIVEKDHIIKATSLFQLTSTITQILSPAIAGIVIATIGGKYGLLFDGLSYLISAIAIYIIKFPSPSMNIAKQNGFWNDLLSGFKWLIKQPIIMSVVILGPLLSLFGSAHTILLLIIALKVWEVNGIEYGLIETAWPIGVTIASIVLFIKAKQFKHRGLIISISFSVSGISYVLASIMPNFITSYPFLVISGFLAGGSVTMMTILLRTIVPASYQGRVFGFYGSLSNATWPLGALLAGILSDNFSIILLAVFCGIGLFLTGILGLTNQKLRSFN